MVLDGDGANPLLQLHLYAIPLFTYNIILTGNIGYSDPILHLHIRRYNVPSMAIY